MGSRSVLHAQVATVNATDGPLYPLLVTAGGNLVGGGLGAHTKNAFLKFEFMKASASKEQ